MLHPETADGVNALQAIGRVTGSCQVSDPGGACSVVPALFASLLGRDDGDQRSIEWEVTELLAAYRGLAGGPQLEFAEAATFLLAALSSAFDRPPTPQQTRDFREVLRRSLVTDGVTPGTSGEAHQMGAEVCGVLGVHVLREITARRATAAANEVAATRAYVDRLA